MHRSRSHLRSATILAAAAIPLLLALRPAAVGAQAAVSAPVAQVAPVATFPADAIHGMKWRHIGPFRAGRTKSGVGVATQPNVFYMAPTNGGVWKSTDYGRTWNPIFDAMPTGSIGALEVAPIDPKNPDRLFVAVLGHPYGPNAERGIYRSVDGGRSFARVLCKNETTGGADVLLAPDDPNTVYAVLWEAQQGPWENAAWQGANSGLFKSTDGGKT